ncbi:hypothetical protein CKAH01_11541 [Colletotrichum kahawae]|uniref:Ankyrin repeat protein n=1 Tax=Colletotrichum kahawae TaxID=34407 RepID=A0AAD9YVX9_COLKA|nr:hypothetical protein CKAH01_11541 [Colletotrichum kahawae]
MKKSPLSSNSPPSSPTSVYSVSEDTIVGQQSPTWSSGCSPNDTIIEERVNKSPPPSEPSPSSPTSVYSVSEDTIIGQQSPTWSSGCSSNETIVQDLVSFEVASPLPCPLLTAILDGDVYTVEQLSKQGVPISASDSWLLYRACIQGIDMIQALMQNPTIDFNRELPFNNCRIIHHLLLTPADDFIADKIETIRFLIRRGVSPFHRDNLGDTALHILAGPVHRPAGLASPENQLARLEGLEPQSQTLLEELLDMISEGSFEQRDPINMANNYGNTALVVALLYRNVPGARALLVHGADANIKGELDLFED